MASAASSAIAPPMPISLGIPDRVVRGQVGEADRGARGGEQSDEQRAEPDGDEPAEECGAPVDPAELLALARTHAAQVLVRIGRDRAVGVRDGTVGDGRRRRASSFA